MTLERASALLELGRPEEALTQLAHAGEHAISAEGQCLRALACLRLDRVPEAAAAAAAARAAAPADEWGYRLGALAAQRDGQLRQAQALALEAVALAPQEVQTYQVAAVVLLGAGDLHGARRHARQMLELASDLAVSHQTYGRVLLAQGELPTAEAALREALALDPQDAQTLSLLAETTARQGSAEQARQLQLASVRSAPLDRQAQARLASRGSVSLVTAAAVLLGAVLLVRIVVGDLVLYPAGPVNWGAVAFLAGLYALAFVGSRLLRRRAGRSLPPGMWDGLRAHRRNRDLLWLAGPAGVLLATAAPVLVLRPSVRGSSVVLGAAAVLGLCWLLRQGRAREMTLRLLRVELQRWVRGRRERGRLRRAQRREVGPWVRGSDPTVRERTAPALTRLVAVLLLGPVLALAAPDSGALALVVAAAALGALRDGPVRTVAGRPVRVVRTGTLRGAGPGRTALRGALGLVLLLPIAVQGLLLLRRPARLLHDRLSGCEIVGLTEPGDQVRKEHDG